MRLQTTVDVHLAQVCRACGVEIAPTPRGDATPVELLSRYVCPICMTQHADLTGPEKLRILEFMIQRDSGGWI